MGGGERERGVREVDRERARERRRGCGVRERELESIRGGERRGEGGGGYGK